MGLPDSTSTLRRRGSRAWRRTFQWQGGMQQLPCRAAMDEPRLESAQAIRDRHRQLRGRSRAGSYVQDDEPRRALRARKRSLHEAGEQGPLLSRRTIRDARRCRRSLQHLLQAGPRRRGEARPRRIPEVASGEDMASVRQSTALPASPWESMRAACACTASSDAGRSRRSSRSRRSRPRSSPSPRPRCT
jgi:hypothetical protein